MYISYSSSLRSPARPTCQYSEPLLTRHSLVRAEHLLLIVTDVDRLQKPALAIEHVHGRVEQLLTVRPAAVSRSPGNSG